MDSVVLHDVSLIHFVIWILSFDPFDVFRFSAVQFISIYMFVPETRRAILLLCEAKRLREQTGDLRYRARIEDVSFPLSCTSDVE